MEQWGRFIVLVGLVMSSQMNPNRLPGPDATAPLSKESSALFRFSGLAPRPLAGFRQPVNPVASGARNLQVDLAVTDYLPTAKRIAQKLSDLFALFEIPTSEVQTYLDAYYHYIIYPSASPFETPAGLGLIIRPQVLRTHKLNGIPVWLPSHESERIRLQGMLWLVGIARLSGYKGSDRTVQQTLMDIACEELRLRYPDLHLRVPSRPQMTTAAKIALEVVNSIDPSTTKYSMAAQAIASAVWVSDWRWFAARFRHALESAMENADENSQGKIKNFLDHKDSLPKFIYESLKNAPRTSAANPYVDLQVLFFNLSGRYWPGILRTTSRNLENGVTKFALYVHYHKDLLNPPSLRTTTGIGVEYTKTRYLGLGLAHYYTSRRSA